jgi:ribosomal protein S11
MMQAAQTEMMVGALSGKDTDGKAILSRYQQAQDEAEDATAKFVAKDLYDEEKIARKIISDPIKKLTGIDSEKDSLLGAKSDSLVQSGGQLIAQLGANAIAPGSGMALMAATAFGSEAEGAFKNDATFDEALLSATISAGAEILTEKIGGISFGGKTLTDAAFEGLSRKMTSKIAKVLITSGKVAADMTAEGAEEILSGYMSAIGQKLTYMEDKEIEELFSKEDMLESFIGGAVLGGAGSVGSVVQANSKGVDYVTGLTKNEQAVAQKVYEDELAKKEEKGKVSSREKNKLYNSVVKDMELGRIDTDTIESVLGGESYESYKALTEQETSLKERQKTLQTEIEALQDSDNTIRNNRKLQEAEAEMEKVTEQLKGIDTKSAN